MRLDIFHLEARSTFHFGERGVGIEESADHAPSDTVFSALCHTVLTTATRGTLENMLDAFAAHQPPFLIGGGYPYVRLNDALLRFYPAPAMFPFIPTANLKPEKGAEFNQKRKAHWLSETLFYAWLNGELTATQLVDQTTLLHGDKVLVTNQEQKQLADEHFLYDDTSRLWHVGEVPRVAVDRITNASNVYQVGRLTFVRGGGLWCACACLNWNAARMRELFTWMGHVGMGGERSSGYGQFGVLDALVSLDIPNPSDTRYFVTLAHYHPQPTERPVLGERAAYALLLRRGWMDSPADRGLRRPPVRMVAAGSVLHSLPDENVYGELVDVTPAAFGGDHRIWRYGYALAVGIPSL
jgi:CRISPR-associated protein Csm4